MGLEGAICGVGRCKMWGWKVQYVGLEGTRRGVGRYKMDLPWNMDPFLGDRKDMSTNQRLRAKEGTLAGGNTGPSYGPPKEEFFRFAFQIHFRTL